eukprot:Gb_04335 [translate_table: standard]
MDVAEDTRRTLHGSRSGVRTGGRWHPILRRHCFLISILIRPTEQPHVTWPIHVGTGRRMAVEIRAELPGATQQRLHYSTPCWLRLAIAYAVIIVVVMLLLGGAMAAEMAQSPSPTPETGAAAAPLFAPSMGAAFVASLTASACFFY